VRTTMWWDCTRGAPHHRSARRGQGHCSDP
jgi:hypothetical protein